MSCFACIFVPDFPAEAILRVEPELRAQAVAVLAGKSPLEKVVSVNERARQAGVEPGMTKIQLEAWNDLILRPRSELQEATARAALLDCAQSFSPAIEETAADTLLVDLEGVEHLFGSFLKISRDIARRASDFGLEVNVAVASNADTAMLAARGFAGVTFIPEGKEAHRLGELPVSVLFEGLLSSEQQKEAERVLDTLDRWGLRNLRALAALPEIPLSERLGQEGLRLQRLARGTSRRTLKLFELPLIFEEAVELEHPIVLLEPLAFMLNRMLEQLCNRLAARALAVQELRLRFELATEFQTEEVSSDLSSEIGDKASTNARQSQPSRSSTYMRMLHLPVPMLDARIFLKLLQLDLRGHPPGAPIMKIYLAAEPARPRAAQAGLFQPAFPEPEKLELTLARMSGILGEDKLGSIELLDTHRPEAFRMQHFSSKETEMPRKKTDGVKPPEAKGGALISFTADSVGAADSNLMPRVSSSSCCVAISTSTALAVDSPEELIKEEPNIDAIHRQPDQGAVEEQREAPITALRMFRPPARAEVAMREGVPVRLMCPKRKDLHGEIVWTAGPWRSSGDWWEQEGWARDEWDIALQNENGFALYRLVRDHFSGRWAVEGSYD